MKVYIVIVTYNGQLNNWINKCLKSIRNSKQNCEIIVVDNASTDDTLSFIKKSFNEVIVLPQKQNLGFGQANNKGIQYALQKGADYVFLLNQDAYIKPNTLKELIYTHQQNPEYGILSPIHLNGEANGLDRNFSYYVGVDKNKHFYFDAIQQELSRVYEVPFVNAAAWLLPRTTLETIGGFDPIFFHYGEDDNYCQRVLFHGYKIGVCTSSYVLHDRLISKKKHQINQHQQLLFKERKYKVQYANINQANGLELLQSKIRIRKRTLLKRTIILQFKKIKYLKSEILMLKRIFSEITKSRRINRAKGLHYLK